ncbi:MAG TPA: hypothetical protein VHT68_25155 [Pseudolabrys sp.]|jgi:hypothetical protein|nr:hypothetical protein [Pseudolabrys sp.]
MSAQLWPLEDSGEWILKTIKRNPEALLLLAAGAVLMMRTNVPQSIRAASMDAAYGTTPDAAGRSASAFAETVTDTARRTMDTAASYASTASETARQTMDAAKSYASSAGEFAGEARRKVGEQSDRVVRQTRSMAEGVLQNQPLAIVMAGLAAGAALAAALPPTELEKETLGPMGDQMSKAAERVGDQLKQASMKAGERLKSAAEERGLHAQGLKDVASEVADTFKTSMKGQPEQTNDGGPATQPANAGRSG